MLQKWNNDRASHCLYRIIDNLRRIDYLRSLSQRFKAISNEKGAGLVEVLISLSVTGVIGVGFLGGLTTASSALFVTDERTTSESLVRSQMEYVKNQNYITAVDYDPGPSPTGGEVIYQQISSSQIPAGYTIMSVNRAGNTVTDIIGVPWNSQSSLPVTSDDGLQRITIVIRHHGTDVITLEGFKVDR
jgi:hypothetical protein